MRFSPVDAACRLPAGIAVFLFGTTTAPWVAGAAALALTTAVTDRARPGRILPVVPFAVALAALCRPAATFAALESAVPWLLMAAGAAHLVLSPSRAEARGRWWGLMALVGLVEIDFGSWAVGDHARAATVVVLWTAVLLIAQAVTEIVSIVAAERRHTGTPCRWESS